MQGLKVLNEADFRYKSSNNQRLLTELSLMQLHQLLVDEAAKKKSLN
jgi:predicted HAD superfamily Cof-like phosphohydrolase